MTTSSESFTDLLPKTMCSPNGPSTSSLNNVTLNDMGEAALTKNNLSLAEFDKNVIF